MWTVLRGLFLEHVQDTATFGRIASLPFLCGAFGLLLASGIVGILHHQSVMEEAASLAVIGFSLYSGSKYLSLKGQSTGQEPQVQPMVTPVRIDPPDTTDQDAA